MGDATVVPSPEGGGGAAGIDSEASLGAATPRRLGLPRRWNARKDLKRRRVPWIWIACGLAVLVLVGRGLAGPTLARDERAEPAASVAAAEPPTAGTGSIGRPGASATVGSTQPAGALPTAGPTPASSNQRITLALADQSATTATSPRSSTSPGSNGSDRSVSKQAVTGSPIIGVQSGLCINVQGGSTEDYTSIDLLTCNGGAAQAISPTADGELRVLGKCLDVWHSATSSGSGIVLFACNGQENEQWSLLSDGAIRGVQSNLCLAGASQGTSGTLALADCTGGKDQAWKR